MAEEKKRVTKEELFMLISNVIDVEIAGETYGLRPVTWREDLDIDKAVDSDVVIQRITDEKTKRIEKARMRTHLLVWKGTVEPDLTKDEVNNLPVGLVMRIAEEITRLSSFLEKK